MTRILLVAAIVSSLAIGYTAPAYACGVKLTVKAPRVKQQVKTSDNPSRILLVGDPPRRLTTSLSEAGHSVDVAEDPKEAKKQRYAIVIADRDKVQESRAQFPRSQVIARSGSTRANIRAVEQTLAGNPVTDDERMVASRSDRSGPRQARRTAPQPRRSSPDREVVARNEVSAPQPDEGQAVIGVTSPSTTGEAEGQRTAVVTLPREDRQREDTRREDKPARVAAGNQSFTEEFFFGPNSMRLSNRARVQLAENARWLKANPEISIRIEGHTDSPGPAEYNMILGERRAASVKEFLVSRGVDASRIETISYGEERPAYEQDSKNRRVHIVRQ